MFYSTYMNKRLGENTVYLPSTMYAIRAVTLRKTCGRYAASQYARKHGVYPLYRLALQLEAI